MIMTYKLKLSIFDLLQVSILITYMFTIIMITTYRLKLSIFSNVWPSKGQHAHYIHVQLHHDHNIPILSSIAEIHTNGTPAQALFRDFETQTAVVKNWEGFMKKRYDVKDCTWDVDYFHVLTFWKNHNKQLTFFGKNVIFTSHWLYQPWASQDTYSYQHVHNQHAHNPVHFGFAIKWLYWAKVHFYQWWISSHGIIVNTVHFDQLDYLSSRNYCEIKFNLINWGL